MIYYHEFVKKKKMKKEWLKSEKGYENKIIIYEIGS